MALLTYEAEAEAEAASLTRCDRQSAGDSESHSECHFKFQPVTDSECASGWRAAVPSHSQPAEMIVIMMMCNCQLTSESGLNPRQAPDANLKVDITAGCGSDTVLLLVVLAVEHYLLAQ